MLINQINRLPISRIPIKRKILTCNFEPLPLTGIDIGIPLNLIENLFTTIHYGENIVTFKQLLIQFLIGYYTYGKDRYIDAIEYKHNPKLYNITTKKENLYDTFNNNKIFYKLSYDITFSLITYLLLINTGAYNSENTALQLLNVEAMPFLLLLYTSEYYRELKRISPFIKPTYVSLMWTVSTIILPGYLYEHNYNILYDFKCYIPCMLSLFAVTNLADVKDLEEDTINNVKTIPVVFGIERTKMLIFISLVFSSLIFGLNQHYIDRPIINSLYEIQNIGVSLITQQIKNDTEPML